MLSIVKTLRGLFSQRLVVYVIAMFISLVLFNTTFMSLGTVVPIGVIVLGVIVFALCPYKTGINSLNFGYTIMGFLILLSTLLSGGNQISQCLKIILTCFFVYMATKISISDKEMKFLSLVIVASYLIYAVLVLHSIGGETEYYGRVQIRILGSDYPLDPNVVSAVFILPFVISIYNLLFGSYKLLAMVFAMIFFIAIVVLGSRGAFLSLSLCSFIMIGEYLFSKQSSLFLKILVGLVILVAISYSIVFLSSLDNIVGLDRILDFESDDVSNGRTDVWLERLKLLESSPIFGYGINYDVGISHRGMACHNTIIQLLHYGGIIGFVLFVIPTYQLYKRRNVPFKLKLVLFISVFCPIFFIDTLQERTLWNFIIFYSFLSVQEDAENCLLWNSN